MKQPDKPPASRRPSGLEENLKKALTELLILFLFHEKEHYIGELSPLLEERSKGALSIVFPYAAIYRLTSAGYLTETKKRNAPDGRLRHYLADLLTTYETFFQGIQAILSGEEST